MGQYKKEFKSDFISTIIRGIALLFFRNDVKVFSNLLKKVHYQFKISLPNSISQNLIKMLIIAEDKRFYMHGGVDIKGIARAIRNNLIYNKKEGGSTIQQQLVRVITGKYEYSYRRKLKEILLATVVIKYIPRNDIASLYLFIAYYGWRANGIIQLGRILNINLANVSNSIAAYIIARLKYPQAKEQLIKQRYALEKRANYIYKEYSISNDKNQSLQEINEAIFAKQTFT